MCSLYYISMSWLIIRHEVQRTPSWMVSVGITIKDKIRYSMGNLLLQGDAIQTEKY